MQSIKKIKGDLDMTTCIAPENVDNCEECEESSCDNYPYASKIFILEHCYTDGYANFILEVLGFFDTKILAKDLRNKLINSGHWKLGLLITEITLNNHDYKKHYKLIEQRFYEGL